MLMMHKAWDKGISPHEFRSSSVSDLMFILDMDNAKSKIKNNKMHEQKIKEAMMNIQMRGSKW